MRLRSKVERASGLGYARAGDTCLESHPGLRCRGSSRENLHRSFQEESIMGLGWCRNYERGHILRWDEVRHRWGQNSGDEASE